MWTIDEHDLGPTDPDVRSSLFSVGNGRMCTRGTLGEDRFDAYRAVFVSGLYTVAPFGLAYFLSAPDWLPVILRIDGAVASVRSSRRVLDLRSGILQRTAVFVHGDDAVELREERLVSWAFPQLAAQRVELRRLAGTRPLSLSLGLDGEVRQSPAKYYQPGQIPACDETGLRLAEIEDLTADPDRLRVTLFSPQTGRRTRATAAVRRVRSPADGDPPVPSLADGRALLTYQLPADGPSEHPWVFEKLCLVTSDLDGIEDARRDAQLLDPILTESTWAAASEAHRACVEAFWDDADVVITGDEQAQRAVRFALWATRCAAPNDEGLSSLGAKNLTGDWYQGAVFWDMEAYQLPLLTAIAPHLARNHLRYRCRRLGASRSMAARDGYRGARYAGMSYQSGLEEPPRPAGSLGVQEIHVSIEVAWGMQHYLAMTGDTEALFAGGLEVVLEVARFWISRVEQDPDGTWHLREICGPDELHKPVADNTYTNLMVRELLVRADELIERFLGLDGLRTADLLARLGLDDAERRRWREVAAALHLPRRPDGLPEQFTGHAELPEPNPLLITRQGMGADQVGKQADTLMLLQMIPWAVPAAEHAACYRTYAPLCNQTSSLSLCTHALIAARLGLHPDAVRYFDWAATVDLNDTMGNTAHGLHAAGQGGIWLMVVGGFGGLTVSPDGLDISPLLPPDWESLSYRVRHHGTILAVEVTPREVTITNRGTEAVDLRITGDQTRLTAGATATFPISRRWHDPGLGGVVIDLPEASSSDRERLADLLSSLAGADLPLALVGPDAPAAPADLLAPCATVVDDTVSSRIKPDPQPFLIATQRLRALPWNCVCIVTDADGVSAAHGAGMAAVALRPGLEGADADLPADPTAALDVLRAARAAHVPDVNPYLARNQEIVRSETSVKAFRF